MKGDVFDLIVKVLVFAIPTAAFFGFMAPLVLGMENLSTLGFYMTLPMILSTFAYLAFCRDEDGEASRDSPGQKRAKLE